MKVDDLVSRWEVLEGDRDGESGGLWMQVVSLVQGIFITGTVPKRLETRYESRISSVSQESTAFVLSPEIDTQVFVYLTGSYRLSCILLSHDPLIPVNVNELCHYNNVHSQNIPVLDEVILLQEEQVESRRPSSHRIPRGIRRAALTQ